MMTYSVDFQERILEIKTKESLTYRETAIRFGVGTSSLIRWCKGLIPKRTRNIKTTKIDSIILRKDVQEYPDSYQYERAERLGVSRSGIGSALKRLGISCKKKVYRIQKPKKMQGKHIKTK